MKTFSITTLGCRVNHYESEQLATLLRARGLVQTAPADADVRVVHTCSVTTEAASKSRQTVRRAIRLPVLESRAVQDPVDRAGDRPALPRTGADVVNDALRRRDDRDLRRHPIRPEACDAGEDPITGAH